MNYSLFFAALILAAVLLGGCEDRSEEIALLQQQVQELQTQNQQLQQEASDRGQRIEDIATVIDSMLIQMSTVSRRPAGGGNVQQNLEATSETRIASIEEAFDDHMKAILEQIRTDRRQNRELNSALSTSRSHVEELDSAIVMLEERIEARESEIANKENVEASLQEELERMHTQLGLLEQFRGELEQEIESLSAAYYVVGTRDELMEKGVIDRRGGFLGIGRKTVLNNLDESQFTKVDIATNQVPLGTEVEGAKMLSTHKTDPELYAWNVDESSPSLQVNDPEKFWKTSRYLIIEIKR